MAQATVFVEQNSPAALLRQAGMLVGIAAAVALGVYVVLWARTPAYSMLYADLPDRDLTQIVEVLKAAQVAYQIEAGSGAVLVPSDALDDARLKVAAAGLPRGAAGGFELLEDQQTFGTSQFLERARYQRAVEGELSRSIARIDNVRAARVHLALPAETVFARNRREPSASVIVDLYGGRRLGEEQVAAITHLVSASVPNLPASRVTIVDSQGNLLTDEAGNENMRLTAQRFDYTRRLEDSYGARIVAILSPLVGSDGVRAQVTADLDFTASEQTSERFNPDLPAVRSERLLEEERTGGGTGGVPGALSNAPPGPATAPEQAVAEAGEPGAEAGEAGEATAGTAAPAATPAQGANRRSQTTRNYELDRVISHTKTSLGTIRRLSVAVVVRNPPPLPPAEDGQAAPAAAPAGLGQDEIDRMTRLVKEAIGFDPVRGDTVSVTSADFHAPPAPEPLPAEPIWKQSWVWSAGRHAAGGIFLLLLVFGVLRPAIKALMAKPAGAGPGGADPAAAGLPALAGPAADGAGALKALPGLQDSAQKLALPSGVHDNLEQVKQIVAQDPRVAAQVIKGWVGE